MSEPKEEDTEAVLPCRGCTADCPDRARCGGMPWRLPPEQNGNNGGGEGGNPP